MLRRGRKWRQRPLIMVISYISLIRADRVCNVATVRALAVASS